MRTSALDMVGLSPMAFPASISSSPLSPFDEETMAPIETAMLGSYPRRENSSHNQVQSDVKELGDLLAPGQPVKVQIPCVHRALVKHLGRLSERRVRSMFHGEIDRLWDDERDVLRRELAVAKNTKARQAFHAAAVALVRGLSAAGHPLSYDQTRALNLIVGAAA